MNYNKTFKTKINRIICILFDHKVAYNDSGYDVCGRCGAHEYYNSACSGEHDFPNTWDRAGYLVRPFYSFKWKLNIFFWEIKKLFQKDDLPF